MTALLAAFVAMFVLTSAVDAAACAGCRGRDEGGRTERAVDGGLGRTEDGTPGLTPDHGLNTGTGP